jgi:nitrate reductase gamma subunit
MASLFYLSFAVFLLGMAWRVSAWLRAPVPLKIPLTPGPSTNTGVAARLAGEMVLFRSLWRADKALWPAAWIFHLALVLLAVGHFVGLVLAIECPRLSQIGGGVAGILGMLPLLYLLVRRFLVERVRYISVFGDYFALALLLLVIVTGNQMRFLGGLDLVKARAFVAGLLALHPVPPPSNAAFIIHLLGVCALLVYIPFSKLMHFGGIFLSPTLNQTNDPRQRRHVNPWDHETTST